MKHCTHSSWMKLTKSGIVDTGQFSRIMKDLDTPDSQFPSVITFIGKHEKDIALREMFRRNNFKKAKEDCMLHVRMESDSVRSETPLAIADGTLYAISGPNHTRQACHDETTFPIAWPRTDTQEVADNIFSRVILPLCSVVCLFVDRFIDVQHLPFLTQRWMSYAKSAFENIPNLVRPQLLIVTSDRGTYDQMQKMKDQIEVTKSADLFAAISLVYTDKTVSPEARYGPLKVEVSARLDDAVAVRRYERWLFSANHLQALFQNSLKIATLVSTKPLNYIDAARRYFPKSDLSGHLSSFLSVVGERIPYEETASHIASALLLNAYPPKSHLFEPNLIFQELYEQACLEAFSNTYGVDSFVHSQLQYVHERFCQLFTFIEIGKSSAEVHLGVTKSRCLGWTALRNNRTCLCCLVRSPEYVLSCGHSVCETCIQIFGKGSIGVEHQFDITDCMFCGPKGTLTARLKPPSAGVRLLGVDGGGARGVIPLEVIKLLQNGLGPAFPIQDFFDLVIGTSSGGLIVLGLFLYRWSIGKCTEMFNRAVKSFFPKTSGNLWWKLHGLVNGLIRDSMYDWQMLEEYLQDSFGRERCLFDGANSAKSGVRLAVTATSIADSSVFLFANYNASDTRKPDCGYRSFRALDPSSEPHVWEAARATTAAPLYFRPASVSHLGFFQDGGLGANNPAGLLQEESRHIWPDAAIDLIISLGTGSEEKPGKTAKYRNVVLDGFIPRSIRYLIKSTEGEKDSRALANRLDAQEREKHIRLNVALNASYPLDDTIHMDELRESVRNSEQMPQARRKALLMLLASSFFFELSEIPQFEGGFYRCEGSIRCRGDASEVVKCLRKLVSVPIDFMVDSGYISHFNGPDDICGWCHRYSKSIAFYVRHPSDVVTMSMRMEEDTSMKLSGFPRNMESLVATQMLDSDFGNPQHGCPGLLRCSNCIGSVRQKRKGGYLSESDRRKKPRVGRMQVEP